MEKRFKLIKQFPGFHLDEHDDNVYKTNEHGLLHFPNSSALFDPSQWPEFFEEIKEPLFITEDGIEIFDTGIELYCIHRKRLEHAGTVNVKKIDKRNPNYVYFFSFDSAERWIEGNKPVFSKKQILDAIENARYGPNYISIIPLKQNLNLI